METRQLVAIRASFISTCAKVIRSQAPVFSRNRGAFMPENLWSGTYLGVVLSPRSVASPWVQREVRAALTEEIQNECVKVLPLLIENCEIPGFLRDKLYADFRGNYQRGLSELLHRLKPLDYLPASYNRESLELYLSEEALKAGLEQKIL